MIVLPHLPKAPRKCLVMLIVSMRPIRLLQTSVNPLHLMARPSDFFECTCAIGIDGQEAKRRKASAVRWCGIIPAFNANALDSPTCSHGAKLQEFSLASIIDS